MDNNRFNVYKEIETSFGSVGCFSFDLFDRETGINANRLPVTIRVLLESLLRSCDGKTVTQDNVKDLARWLPQDQSRPELSFMPARVLLQDLTGVPAVVDLAAMRAAVSRMGGDPGKINPVVPVDLVIDHSVQVDAFGSQSALLFNSEREFERNRERYEFLKWGSNAFDNLRVVPPATGIVHQVNLEYLAKVVQTKRYAGDSVAFPDTLVGTDSHTTMINGLGVLAWGVGGIEAEAVMLGQPINMLAPDVIGFKLEGGLREGVTATDLVLTVTQILREHGVVGKFVEFYGNGLDNLTLPDRATISNMAPEYGATVGFFPVDDETLSYLRNTGRDEALVELAEVYCKEQCLFRTSDSLPPEYTDTLYLDMSTVESSVAGPKRPQDRVLLGRVKSNFRSLMTTSPEKGGFGVEDGNLTVSVDVELDNGSSTIRHGSAVIAAITSCTNTSNPSVMVGAGLLAKNAVEAGLTIPAHVKTSLAPGSRVVEDYLRRSGLLHYLEALRFNLVGFGCTTCIGNSGPLPDPIARAITEKDLVAVAVLSGNRNFEGRINPHVKASFLASPPLVVAFALAGKVDMDLTSEPLGHGKNGDPVYLRDIWPSQQDISDTIGNCIKPEMFREQYASVFSGNPKWNEVDITGGANYEWKEESTYIREPLFFSNLSPEADSVVDITGARVIALLGDSVTTDHISPAGAIASDSPAAEYLRAAGVERKDFNTYGSRRGNHEVMTRGTFGNIRVRNLLVPGSEGGVTIHYPTGEQMSIYDAAIQYKNDDTPLLVIAGKDYGMGSSRDWAAKGTFLLGIKAVIFESIERIHRSNLIGMGVLPLQFDDDNNAEKLNLSGSEIFDIRGVEDLEPGRQLVVTARREDGHETVFSVTARIDTPIELEYFRNGGILQTVLRGMM